MTKKEVYCGKVSIIVQIVYIITIFMVGLIAKPLKYLY